MPKMKSSGTAPMFFTYRSPSARENAGRHRHSARHNTNSRFIWGTSLILFQQVGKLKSQRITAPGVNGRRGVEQHIIAVSVIENVG